MKKKVGNTPDHYDQPDRGPLGTILANFPTEGAKALIELSLSEFEQGKYVVKVRSGLLGEDIYFVSNERLLDRVPDGFVVYTAKELRALKGTTKGDLKRTHCIKRIVDGEVMS
jgi:hypothetical protein